MTTTHTGTGARWRRSEGVGPAPEAAASRTTPQQHRPQGRVIGVGVVAALVLAGLIGTVGGGASAVVLFVVGLALGAVLFHSRFGFTSAWRQLVSVRQGAGLRAHMLMLAVAVTLFAPILAGGLHLGAKTPTASLAPIGFGVVVGAFLFGMGMQIGGSCASGTLFSVGSGQTVILLTLAGFIGGAVLGAWNFSWWSYDLPSHAPVSLAGTGLGYLGGWLISMAIIGAVVLATYAVARGRRVPPIAPVPAASGLARVVRGSWPLWVGAVLLAGLNALTLLVSGAPWGITTAFSLWGSKLLDALGVDVTSWGFWADPTNLQKYRAGWLGETTSVMDLGIIVGALIASAAAGAFVLRRKVPGRAAGGAVLGGLLMGYGARIAFGCNIGSYFGGIASLSLHGWLWGAMALLGTYAGLRLRPLFGLPNPRPEDSSC